MITSNSTSPLILSSISEDRVAPIDGGVASLTACRSYLENMVEGIPRTRLRRVVGTVFQDLLRLLECLSIIEGHLRQVNSAEETLAFFQLIRDEARSLIEFIKTDALNCNEVTGQLADTLDGLAFALSHDLRRVFEGEYEADVESSAYVILGRVHRAHDVLTNCLQQSTVSLALVYEPALSVTQLFNNTERRYRQSLKLCSDLECLRDLVQEFIGGLTTAGELNAGLETFRRDSLEFLMYSDWPQFESFCERISVSGEDPSSLAEVLHQFLCYLETLVRQVKMRAVLADESSPILNHLSQGTATYHNEALPLLQTNDVWGGSALPV